MKKRRTDEDRLVASTIGGRITELLDNLPGSLKAKSEILGYQSPSTIYAFGKGSTLPDLVRLNTLAAQTTSRKRPNIDWLITGRGSMLIADQVDSELEQVVKEKLLGQSEDRLRAILTLLETS